MSDEQSQDNFEQQDDFQNDLRDQLDTQTFDNEPQEESIEQKAKSTGHLTEEQYQEKYGTLKGYKSPEEFVRTGDMIDQLRSLKKKLDERDKEMASIINYTNSTIQEHKLKARQEIEMRLQQAREYGNIEAIEALTKQKTEIEFRDQQEQLKEGLSKQQAALNNFVERNKHWYNDQHPELKREAELLDKEIIQRYQNAGLPMPSYEELTATIEHTMRTKYPDLVNTGLKNRPVIQPTNSSVNRASDTNLNQSEDKLYANLSADYKAMFNANKRILNKAGIDFTVKEFVQKLKSDGEI